MAEEDLLFTLAEIAVAMAGFSAVVVIFRRRDEGHWVPGDADRFNGMVVHAMASAFFCVLPSLLRIFTDSAPQLWMLASGTIALQIAVQCVFVYRLPTTGRSAVLTLLTGAGISVLCALNALGIGFEREFRPYLVAVLWHLLQAGVLFVMLVWVRRDDVKPG